MLISLFSLPSDRPDLVDWRALRQRSPRERLETAFNVMEREYGVTRLLDPEGEFSEVPVRERMRGGGGGRGGGVGWDSEGLEWRADGVSTSGAAVLGV